MKAPNDVRKITFDARTGGVIVSVNNVEVFNHQFGVVLIPSDMLTRAMHFGWSPDGATPIETKAGLTRIRRSQHDQIKCEAAQRRAAAERDKTITPIVRARF